MNVLQTVNLNMKIWKTLSPLKMADISRKKVSSVVIHCVQSGYLTLESFNDIIQTISYTDAHKNNQSQSVKIKPLNQFRVKTDCM